MALSTIYCDQVIKGDKAVNRLCDALDYAENQPEITTERAAKEPSRAELHKIAKEAGKSIRD